MKSYSLLLSLLLASAPAVAQQRSLNEVKDRIFAEPLSTLPDESGFSALHFVTALAGRSNLLTIRSKATVTDADDFKTREPKPLHPLGLCAEADWIISTETGYTGLLAKGTKVKAIVRFSTGSDQTTYKAGSTRQFGLAIKLFPTQDPAEKVSTANIFTLDRFELDGSDRPLYMTNAARAGELPLYFWNHASGETSASGLALKVLSKFDKNATLRPLYPVTETDQNNRKVAQPKTPTYVAFFPREAVIENRARYIDGTDFRDELLSYKTGSIAFDIALPKDSSDTLAPKKVGVLKVGKLVNTVACDQELHFFHHPTR